MTWLLYRLYRRWVMAWLMLAIALAATLLILWAVMARSISSHDVQSCVGMLAREQTTSSIPTCSPGAFATLDSFQTSNAAVLAALEGFPLLLGMFMAAPLMGRELEAGTHRLVWTQSVTPVRWLLMRVACCLGLASGLSALVAVATLPWLSLGTNVWFGSKWPDYDLSFVVVIGYEVFAVVLGLSTATVIGRTVAAMAATGVIWVSVRAAFEILMRPHLMAPVIVKGMTAASAGANWFLGITYLDSTGHVLTPAQVSALVGSGSLDGHGISLAGVVQPDGRFWAFQTMETAVFAGLALGCLLVAYSWVKFRLASQ